MSSMFLYQQAKSLIELKKDIEHALHRGSAVTGSGSAPRQFNGLLNALSSNMTSSSGTTLTEKVYGDILDLTYQNGAAKPEWAFCNSRIKRTISEFEKRNTFNMNADAREQILAVDFLTTDFGRQAVYMSRDQLRSTADNLYGNSWVAIDPRYFVTGWLQPVRSEQLTRDGLRERFQLSCKLTLIVKNELAGCGQKDVVANIAT